MSTRLSRYTQASQDASLGLEEVPVDPNNPPGPMHSDTFTLIKEEAAPAGVDDQARQTPVWHLYARGINPPTRQDDHIFHVLMQASPATFLNVHINSRGGVLNTGLRLVNTMQSFFATRTTTLCESDCMSMGALTFVRGDRRIVYPTTSFMFHDYSAMIFGTGGSIENRTRHDRWVFDEMMDGLVEKGWLLDDEYQSMLDGKDIYIRPTEMLDRGIATHIQLGRQLLTREGYQAYVANGDRTGLESVTCRMIDYLFD